MSRYPDVYRVRLEEFDYVINCYSLDPNLEFLDVFLRIQMLLCDFR